MAKQAVLLVNLGSPDSTTVEDVRNYLNEFLMDKRVIDIPYLLRAMVVKGFILPKRPAESSAAYKKIWGPDGSPLISISKKLVVHLQEKSDLPIGLGMRYGNPSIEQAIKSLLSENSEIEDLLLIPLYPHYAMSSYETVVVKTEELIDKNFPQLQLYVLPPFFNRQTYIQNLATIINESLPGNTQHLLFSYHGLPERHLRKSDPTKSHCLKINDCCNVKSDAHRYCYRHQVIKTTEKVMQIVKRDDIDYSFSFQSRLGWDQWLEPYTDKVIPDLAANGIENLAVVCPAFVADCLETLEEIGIRAREDFLNAGGKEFILIPCLNDRSSWIDTLSKWVNDYSWSQKEVLIPN